jgi:hypothetical protein
MQNRYALESVSLETVFRHVFSLAMISEQTDPARHRLLVANLRIGPIPVAMLTYRHRSSGVVRIR